jgi:hypothetical protein
MIRKVKLPFKHLEYSMEFIQESVQVDEKAAAGPATNRGGFRGAYYPRKGTLSPFACPPPFGGLGISSPKQPPHCRSWNFSSIGRSYHLSDARPFNVSNLSWNYSSASFTPLHSHFILFLLGRNRNFFDNFISANVTLARACI